MFCEAFHYVNSCLTTPNWSDVLQTEPRKKINPQTKLAVHCLINFDNLWETRKAVSIRDICPVSLIPSVFQQAVSAIQAHMVIYNSRDSTPKINCYWQTFTYQRMRGEGGRGLGTTTRIYSCSPSKPISPSLCTISTNPEIFVSFPNDSSLLYFVNYGWEGGMYRQ